MAPVRSASFVSLACDAAAVRERGLPVADYFLWNDDFEYSTRLVRGGTGLYVPTSVVVHKTRVFGATDADPGERFVLEVRNKLWTFTRSRPLDARDTVLYGGATLRRWGRTIARSQRRDVLLGNDAADDHRRLHARLAQPAHDVGDQLPVRAGENRQANDMYALLQCGGGDLLCGQADALIDDIHPGVAGVHGDLLGAV